MESLFPFRELVGEGAYTCPACHAVVAYEGGLPDDCLRCSAAIIVCSFGRCRVQALWEIIDTAERRPSEGVTYSCTRHVGRLLAHLPPYTEPDVWTVRSL